MRITGSHRQEGFWADTWRWLRSQRGRGQFLLGALLGAVLTTVLGLGHLSGIWTKIEVPLRAWMQQARETTQDEIVQNDLPTFLFDIGFEEYQTLAAKREQALQIGVLNLSDEDWLPAEIRYRGDTYPVRIRLKGDWLDHLGIPYTGSDGLALAVSLDKAPSQRQAETGPGCLGCYERYLNLR